MKRERFASFKNLVTKFWIHEENLWHEPREAGMEFVRKVDSNPYFATLSLWFVLLVGILSGSGQVIGGWFQMDAIRADNMAMISLTLFIWCLNMGESVLASKSIRIAICRSLLLLVYMAGALVLGYLGSVILLFLVLTLLVVFLLSGGIGAILKGEGGSPGSNPSTASADQFGFDGSSANKLENLGGGYGRDRDGRRWKNEGGSKWSLDE